jgi:hypothetical protein
MREGYHISKIILDSATPNYTRQVQLPFSWKHRLDAYGAIGFHAPSISGALADGVALAAGGSASVVRYYAWSCAVSRATLFAIERMDRNAIECIACNPKLLKC